MVNLLVMRHAKSDWELSQSDFDRTLNERGKKDAPLMGKLLKKMDLVPQIILSSTAKRAKSTALLVAAEANYKQEIVWKQSFYLCSTQEIINEIRKLDNAIELAMVVAHNDTMENLVSELTSNGTLKVIMSTASIALISFYCKWNEIGINTGTLNWILNPKTVKSMIQLL